MADNSLQHWNEIWSKENDRFYPFFRKIVSILPQDGMLIDVGCGVGTLLKFIKDLRPRLKIQGQDQSDVAIEKIKQNGIDAEVVFLPEVKGKADIILATEVLEHFSDGEKLLQSFLDSAPTVILSTPNNRLKDHPEHDKVYDIFELKSLMDKFYKRVVIWDMDSHLVAFGTNVYYELPITVEVAIPNTGILRKELAMFASTIGDNFYYDVALRMPEDRPTSNNRNKIAKHFLATGKDYLLQLDSDLCPTRNPLEWIALDKAIIGAPYPQVGDGGLWWVAADWNGTAYDSIGDPERMKGLQKIDALGTGCLLIKREVLEKITKPFEREYDEFGIQKTGHDFYFCRKAKNLGYDVWIHWDYPCEHWKTTPLLNVLNNYQYYGRK